MATIVASVPQSLPFDDCLAGGSGYHHHSPMNDIKQMSALNTQQYDLSVAFGTGTPPPTTMTAQQVQSELGPTPMTGKRARSSKENDGKSGSINSTEDDGRKKRSRGRPRLDTKDETAADRRRTQIRLAQRAYRHRKDTTITTLEQRVKELEKANDDISKGFSDFYDILLSERVLEAAPHAIQRLSALAGRITAAADKVRNSTVDDSGTDESEEHTGSNHGQYHGLEAMPSTTHRNATVRPPEDCHSDTSLHTSIIGTSGTSAMPGSTLTTAPAHPPGPLIHVPTSLNYEVVTAATPDNASFPFYSSMESTAVDSFDGSMAADHGLYSSIASPSSYASHELTFGRRLQRHSVEKGLRLIMMANPPPDRFAAVFGFCLFFESKEAIIKRLQLSLSRNQHEDLSHWRFPFTHLGGAGTYFPQPSIEDTDSTKAAMPIGNQGTRSYGKPQELTGLSMGPFGPEVEATRDERIDRKMRMLWPGFEGEFFDPDEVEIYLRQLGIFIPQRAEYVEADIDISDLDRDESSTRASSSSASVPNRHQAGFTTTDSGYGGSNQGGTWASDGNSPISGAADGTGPSVAVNMAQQPPVGIAGSHGHPPPSEYGHEMVSFMLPSGSNRVWSQSMTWPVKSKVALNVSVLIKELANNAVCLGRTPGIRRKDVNLAVKIAAGLAASPV